MTNLRPQKRCNKADILYQFAVGRAPRHLHPLSWVHSCLSSSRRSFTRPLPICVICPPTRNAKSLSPDARIPASRRRSTLWPITARLAFVSKTPGRTQHLNYFRLDRRQILRRPARLWICQGTRRKFVRNGRACSPPICVTAKRCAGLVLIMDSRHPLTELDLQMLGWFAPTGKPIHVSAFQGRQVDSPGAGARISRGADGTDRDWQQLHPATFLELEEVGGDGGRGGSWRWLGLAVTPKAPPPTGLATEKTARAKKRSAIGWGARSVDRAGGRH
jgi:GTP-binding protein